MNSELIAALQQYSDEYALTLWNRFVMDQPASEQERATFSHIARRFDRHPGQPIPQDLQAIVSPDGSDRLSVSFFSPGSTADIFINCHTPIMNNIPHAHDFFEIIYVAQGDVVDWVDGVRIPLQQSDICIHNPNAKNMLIKMDAGTDIVLNIVLPPRIFERSFYSTIRQNRQLDEFFSRYALSTSHSSNYMVFHNISGRVDTVMELLVDEFLRKEDSSRLILESTLVVLFGELIRHYQPDPFLRELVELIESDMTGINIEQAAAHFNYHRNYFSALVKNRTGRTFGELLTELRLHEAVTMLHFTDKSLESIAECVGYSSTASFYQNFRKKYGMTPGAYRRQSEPK